MQRQYTLNTHKIAEDYFDRMLQEVIGNFLVRNNKKKKNRNKMLNFRRRNSLNNKLGLFPNQYFKKRCLFNRKNRNAFRRKNAAFKGHLFHSSHRTKSLKASPRT